MLLPSFLTNRQVFLGLTLASYLCSASQAGNDVLYDELDFLKSKSAEVVVHLPEDVGPINQELIATENDKAEAKSIKVKNKSDDSSAVEDSIVLKASALKKRGLKEDPEEAKSKNAGSSLRYRSR